MRHWCSDGVRITIIIANIGTLRCTHAYCDAVEYIVIVVRSNVVPLSYNNILSGKYYDINNRQIVKSSKCIGNNILYNMALWPTAFSRFPAKCSVSQMRKRVSTVQDRPVYIIIHIVYAI